MMSATDSPSWTTASVDAVERCVRLVSADGGVTIEAVPSIEVNGVRLSLDNCTDAAAPVEWLVAVRCEGDTVLIDSGTQEW